MGTYIYPINYFLSNITGLTLDTIVSSGSSYFYSLSATTFSGGSIYSGTTNLYDIFITTAGGGATVDQLNTKVNRSGDTMTGNLYVPGLSATTLSGESIYSGTTNLSSVFMPIDVVIPTQASTTGPGLNTYTGGTALAQTVNISAFTGANIISSGLSRFDNLSAITISGENIFSGTTNLNNLFSYINHNHNYSAITVDSYSSSTYSNLKNFIDTSWSCGRISGGTIIDNGNGTISVDAGSGMIRTIDDILGNLIFFDWSSNSSILIADRQVNYIYVDYNNGNPTVLSTINYGDINQTTNFVIATAYLENNYAYTSNAGLEISNFPRKVQRRIKEAFGYQRVSGLITSETGTRNLYITAGVIWYELNRLTTDLFDSSSGDTYDLYYDTGGTVFSITTGETQIDNTQYSNGTSLSTLTNNRYGTRYVFMSPGNKVSVVYGSGNYAQLSQAQSESIPSSLPLIVKDYSLFVAKIIILKNASSFVDIQIPFDTLVSSSSVQNHNDLSGIQGGSVDEYYHLNNSDYSASINLQNKLDSKSDLSGATFNGGISAITISGGEIYSGSTNLSSLFMPIGATVGGGSGSYINNGLNTYTGGSATFQTVNISGLTINNIDVSGSSNFVSLTASTIKVNIISGATYYGDGSNLTGISGSFGLSIDGAGSVITSGVKAFTIMPENRTIVGWSIISDVSGNCAVDIWKSTTIPTSANTITGSEIPRLDSQQINSDNNLTTWNTSILANDIVYFNVISASTVTKLNLIIKTIKN